MPRLAIEDFSISALSSASVISFKFTYHLLSVARESYCRRSAQNLQEVNTDQVTLGMSLSSRNYLSAEEILFLPIG